MYNFLQEAAGLLTSKDVQIIKFMQEDDEQIEECGCWTEEEEEEEEEEETYSYIWDFPLPDLEMDLEMDMTDYNISKWDVLIPDDFEEIMEYLLNLEDSLDISFPPNIKNTEMYNLFLDLYDNEDGTVTISVNKENLIDYLKEEC